MEQEKRQQQRKMSRDRSEGKEVVGETNEKRQEQGRSRERAGERENRSSSGVDVGGITEQERSMVILHRAPSSNSPANSNHFSVIQSA